MRNGKCNSDHLCNLLSCKYNNVTLGTDFKNPNHSTMDTLLESLITVVTNHDSIKDLIDRFIESKSTDSEQNDFIQRTIDIGFILSEAGNRLYRKRASAHNALVWPLSYDISVKVFSMIDTQSVCNVGAACSFFHKCTTDPLCYANIVLVNNPKANDALVSTMLKRAGNKIQSIKLGVTTPDKQRGPKTSNFTRSFLSSLTRNVGAPGLRRLHLYNIIGTISTKSLFSSSAYGSLVDLKIVCLSACSSKWSWNLKWESVSRCCPLLERLIFEISPPERHNYGLGYLKSSGFVRNCPNITTLALKGFRVSDSMAHELVKGLHKLKYVDFSTSSSFTGAFLKNLGTIYGGNNLEVMILRHTMHLSKVMVEQFIAALVAGEWSSLRHLDISHIRLFEPFCTSSIRKQLLEKRPDFRLVAEFGNNRYVINNPV